MNKKTFFAPLEAMLDQRSVSKIRAAYRMAKSIHRNQRRKSSIRYFEHPREVAWISMQYKLDVNLIIACLLHDTLEDGNDPQDADEIETMFGSEILRIVKQVTKLPKGGFHERFALLSDWDSRWVKACDRLHNLRTLPEDLSFQKKQYDETKDLYMPIFLENIELVPSGYHKPMSRIVTDLETELKLIEEKL